MYTPNKPKDEQNEYLPEWHEPFPEPNTIPLGWNFSPTSPASVSAAEMDTEEPAED